MSEPLRIVVSDAPLTAALRARTELAGRAVEFPQVRPIHRAFRRMIREGAYDVSEMAIGAYLQAREAGHDLLLLPVVMSGDFHHRSLYTAGSVDVPAELTGRTIGVRSYSQTSGLWVRGWLEEEEGVRSGDVSWLVNEGSHVEEFHDPDNVEPTETPLKELLATGGVDAAILGLSDDVTGLVPLLPNPVERALAWYERHDCVPVNHLLVTPRAVAEREPEMLAALYEQLAHAIGETPTAGSRDAGLPSALACGRARVSRSLALGARYAFQQRLLAAPVGDVDELFVPGLGD